jgi:hypothetical protein
MRISGVMRRIGRGGAERFRGEWLILLLFIAVGVAAFPFVRETHTLQEVWVAICGSFRF